MSLIWQSVEARGRRGYSFIMVCGEAEAGSPCGGIGIRSLRVLGQAGCIERVRGGTVPGGVREEIGKHARHYDIRTLHP